MGLFGEARHGDLIVLTFTVLRDFRYHNHEEQLRSNLIAMSILAPREKSS